MKKLTIVLVVLAIIVISMTACGESLPPACKISPENNGWIDCSWSNVFFEDADEASLAWQNLPDEKKALVISEQLNEALSK